MYGKHFQSMYTGSMIGAGALVFAVWGYAVSNYRLDRKVGAQVELNPRLLAPILGEDVKDVVKAIEFLCSPDPESRSKEEGGRRLIRIGQFDYRVVNGEKYSAIRDEEARREYQREWVAKKRERQNGKGKVGGNGAKPSPAESEEEKQRRQEDVSRQYPKGESPIGPIPGPESPLQ